MVVVQVHHVDVVAAQVLQDPRVHGRVAPVGAVVQDRHHVVAEARGAEHTRHVVRRQQSALRVLQLLQGNAHGSAEVAHQITHGRPGIDYEVPRPAYMFLDPVG